MQDRVTGDEHPESRGSGGNDAPATVDGNAEMPSSARAKDTSKRKTLVIGGLAAAAAQGLALVQLEGGSTFTPAAIGNSGDFATGAAAISVSTSSTGKPGRPDQPQAP